MAALPVEVLNFSDAMKKIMTFSRLEEFELAEEQVLVADLFAFGSTIFPAKDSIQALRQWIKESISHEEMEVFLDRLLDYMDRIHTDFRPVGAVQVAEASTGLMNLTFALKFVMMEYLPWDKVNEVNEEGKALLQNTGALFLPPLEILKAMRARIMEQQPFDLLLQAVGHVAGRDKPSNVELLERLRAESENRFITETLIEDFYNKHARKDIWDKVYETTNKNGFLSRNPSQNLCCYCRNLRLDSGVDFAIVNICWDLYCLPCIKLIKLIFDGHCIGVRCGKLVDTFISTETFRKFKEAVAEGLLGPYEETFIEPIQEGMPPVL